MKRISLDSYFKKVLKSIEWSANNERETAYKFNQFFNAYLSLIRFGGLKEGVDCIDIINKIYFAAIGATRDQIIDIGKRWSMDNAKARGLGHENFEKLATEEEIALYKKFNRMHGWDMDDMDA
jgi:hypothetical protein